MATKLEKHQNDISNDGSLHALLNGENSVPTGVLNNTCGNYARI